MVGHRGRRRLYQIVRYAILFVALWFFQFPIVWLVATGFKQSGEYLHHPPIWIPNPPTLEQYQYLISGAGTQAMLSSLIVASGTTILNIIIGAPAAYSLARWRTGGNFLPMWILSQRMVPPIALILPLFLVVRDLGWIDTYQGLIMVYLVFNLPFTVWLLRGFFREIPVEIEESASVDGAGALSVLLRIALPLAAGGIIAAAVFCFIFSWTEFLFALVLTRTNAVTLPIYLTSQFGTMFTLWGPVGAISTVILIPMFVLTIAAQRYLVRGLTFGAVK